MGVSNSSTETIAVHFTCHNLDVARSETKYSISQLGMYWRSKRYEVKETVRKRSGKIISLLTRSLAQSEVGESRAKLPVTRRLASFH